MAQKLGQNHQLQKVDYGTMLVNLGSEAKWEKATHPMDRMAN
jgi:hypothetical protein